MNTEAYIERMRQLKAACRADFAADGTDATISLYTDFPGGDELSLVYAAMASAALSIEELGAIILLFAERMNGEEVASLGEIKRIPSRAVPISVRTDGSCAFFRENDSHTYPPHDSIYQLIHLTYEYYRRGGGLSLLRQEVGGLPLITLLREAMLAAHTETETTLCYSDRYIDQADWVLCCELDKSGLLLIPSVLRYRAAGELGLLLSGLGYQEAAMAYSYCREELGYSICRRFYTGEGLLLSATDRCSQRDLWGSCIAYSQAELLNEGIREEVRDSVMRYFLTDDGIREGHAAMLTSDGAFSERELWEDGGEAYIGFYSFPAMWIYPVLADKSAAMAERFMQEHIEKALEAAASPYLWSGLIYDSDSIPERGKSFPLCELGVYAAFGLDTNLLG